MTSIGHAALTIDFSRKVRFGYNRLLLGSELSTLSGMACFALRNSLVQEC